MRIANRKASFEYSLGKERFEAGLVLSGGEAKSIRGGHADLGGSSIRIIGNEAWLINANIPVSGVKFEAKRSRKLLLHRKELLALTTKGKREKLTLVPTAMYTKGRLIKLELALGKIKKKFEKRREIKKREIERELARQLKDKSN